MIDIEEYKCYECGRHYDFCKCNLCRFEASTESKVSDSYIDTHCTECQHELPKHHIACRVLRIQAEATKDKEPKVTKYSTTPDYYLTEKGDLYDIFIARYGFPQWYHHVKMECIQYLDRAQSKDQFESDIAKVITICERILSEYRQSGEKK